jgi:hypothetical protein
MAEHEEYLGDGLYVSFDGWHFCLRAPRDSSAPYDYNHVVYLEPGRGQTLEAFLDYVNRTQAQLHEEYAKAEKAEARKHDTEEGFPNG